MLLFEEATEILQGLYAILMSLFKDIGWDILFFAGIGFMLLFAVFYIIKSRFSYEVRVVKKLLKLNNWLNKNKYIDQNNLIEFNNMMKHTPKHLRYYWHEYMLNRVKNPSYYMSTYNLVEKPLKSSSYLSNIKNFKTTTIIAAGLVGLFALLKLSATVPTLGYFALCALTPLLMVVIYCILSIIMRATQNVNINSLYQYVHYFGRFLDRAVTTMPDYVDFEVLFTSSEIKKGIPVLNEYLEKRARQEQEELEKARINAVEHETYDFSSTGINGSLVLERAINESETFINIRSRLLSEIQQLEDEIESLKRTYENSEKDYQKKMQVSKENVDRLRKQQEETTNRIENNYIKKQQADEIKKQEQLEKDHDSATIRFNQEIEALNTEITTRRKELEERRQYVEDAMKAEYQTFSTKLYKSLESIIQEENQDEKDELLEIKDEIAEELKAANTTIAQRDHEIAELYAILEANGIDRNAYVGFASEKLAKESKRSRRHTKVQSQQNYVEPTPLAPTQMPYDPNLIPLDQIPENQKQYGEDGGFYDPNGYYRYPNGTYFTPNAEFHDEYGGWYEADGVTYHSPEEVMAAAQADQQQTNQADDGEYYDNEGNYRYPNGAYYTPDGRYFDEFGGWYEADGVTYHSPEEVMAAAQADQQQTNQVDDGGYYDNEGNYRYPNGAYYTPDGRYFDEFGGWYEADGVTYHSPEEQAQNQPKQQQPQLEEQPQTETEQPAQEQVKRMEDVPENERQYTEDGGFFDAEGYYYYPNGTYFTPDGRFFDENGGWFEADGVTYHKPENSGDDDQNELEPHSQEEKVYDEDRKEKIVLKKKSGDDVDTAEAEKETISQDALKEIQKLRDQFNIEVDKEKSAKPQESVQPKDEPISQEENKQEAVQPQEINEDLFKLEEAQNQDEQQEPIKEPEISEQPQEELFEQPEELQEEQKEEIIEEPETQDINENLFQAAPESEEEQDLPEEPIQPQIKRGRKPKTEKPVEIMGVAQQEPLSSADLFEGFVIDTVQEPVEVVPAQEQKRGRGRPRKKPVEEVDEVFTEKRGRGRPKKLAQETTASQTPEKRGRGRPKKSVGSAPKTASKGEFDALMAEPKNPELDELEKLNQKIEKENKRLAEHQEELNNQLTETLFQLSSDDE